MIESKHKTELDGIVGNTPLLDIHFSYKGKNRRVFAKAEYINLTGSIKDRMALHILKEAYRTNKLKAGDIVAEATSGNTGISFAAIGRAFGHKVIIYMPDWMSSERIALIRSFGADVILVSKDQGGFLGSIGKCDRMAEGRQEVFLPHQFSNKLNCDAHFRSTGPEILYQLRSLGLVPDGFVAGVGTGGTIMGAGEYFRSKIPDIKLFPVEPAESPTLSTGHKTGNHRIQGISDEFIPKIVDLAKLDKVIGVSDGDAILMAQKLASELGLAVGISSGANFLGAIKAQEEIGDHKIVATIFADSNKKYLSTDLFRDEPVKPGYLSSRVKLKSFKTVGLRHAESASA